MLSDAVPEQDKIPAIELKSVVQKYKNNDSNSVFNFADWSLDKSEQVFLYGESGSGKSTLLNLLSGILLPQSGSIKLFGTDIVALSNRARDKFRADNIGVVFQQFNLIPYLSVAQNVKLASYFSKESKNNKLLNIEELLDKLKLPQSVIHTQVSDLSVGQRQRVAILRAFANSPSLLLVDEPTSALDASARDAFMKMLIEASESQSTTMLFVSHDEALKEYFSKHVSMQSLLPQRNLANYGEDD